MNNGGSLPAMTSTMMILCTFGATAPAQRPSGESVAQQAERILAGINSQLTAQSALMTGAWQAVWLGLTPDRANLAYIAQCTEQNAFAVCLRGTQFNSPLDILEDLEVGTVVEFTPGYSLNFSPSEPIMVSKGAMNAFTEITGAVYAPAGTNLLAALTGLLNAAPSQPTLYITGHSLGGAMATTVALHLAGQTWSNPPILQVFTFAAPTAGLQSFATYYDQVFAGSSTTSNSSWSIVNAWDLVPNAWATLDYVKKHFYPSFADSSHPKGPGPAQNATVKELIKKFMKAPGANQYAQPSINTFTLNSSPAYGNSNTYDPAYTCPTTLDFLGQVGWAT